MQGNWTVCVPLKYIILMPDIQEAKCFEFTVQIISVYALVKWDKSIKCWCRMDGYKCWVLDYIGYRLDFIVEPIRIRMLGMNTNVTGIDL